MELPGKGSDYADCARVARVMLDKETVDALRSLRSMVVLRTTVVIWIQLIAAWAVALYAPLWFLPISFLVNCAMIQAMLLWTHEASHYSCWNNRRVNDVWCDIFFAGPVGISVAAYRAKHLTHHVHLATDLDRDGDAYRFDVHGARALAWFLVKALCGLVGAATVLNKYAAGDAQSSPGARLAVWLPRGVAVGFNLGLLIAGVAAGRWYLYFLLWAYPIVAVSILLNIVRTIAEHQPEDYPSSSVDGHEGSMTPIVRTTVPNVFEKWLLYQANFNFHLEHHLFPGVPQHNLGRLHRSLRQRGFYAQFPQCLQRSGVAKFVALSRNRINTDFSGPVSDAL